MRHDNASSARADATRTNTAGAGSSSSHPHSARTGSRRPTGSSRPYAGAARPHASPASRPRMALVDDEGPGQRPGPKRAANLSTGAYAGWIAAYGCDEQYAWTLAMTQCYQFGIIL